MQLLKLAALDQQDLEVLSAHLQDAVLRVSDVTFLPRQKRFAAIVNRFDWEKAIDVDAGRAKQLERRRSALRFDRVLGAQFSNIRLSAKSAILNLLAISFDETEAPSGFVTFVFAGGGAIRLKVECIEAELKDLGPAWSTKARPEHKDTEPGPAQT